MPHRKQVSRAPALLLLVALAGSAHSRAALLIDDFADYQFAQVAGPPAGYANDSNSLATAGALGGERDIFVERTSSTTGSVSLEVASPDAGAASHSSGVRTAGNSQIVWDGVDGSPLIQPTGLGGFDLTQGGVYDAFSIGATADLGGELIITVYQDATHVSSATLLVAADPTFAFAQLDLPFSSFVAIGAAGGADFANLGALVLRIEGSIPGSDVALTDFCVVSSVVPEPTTWLAGVGLLLFAAATAFRIPRNPRLRR